MAATMAGTTGEGMGLLDRLRGHRTGGSGRRGTLDRGALCSVFVFLVLFVVCCFGVEANVDPRTASGPAGASRARTAPAVSPRSSRSRSTTPRSPATPNACANGARGSPTSSGERKTSGSVGDEVLDGGQEGAHGDAGATLRRAAPCRLRVVGGTGHGDVRPRQPVGHELGEEVAADEHPAE